MLHQTWSDVVICLTLHLPANFFERPAPNSTQRTSGPEEPLRVPSYSWLTKDYTCLAELHLYKELNLDLGFTNLVDHLMRTSTNLVNLGTDPPIW